MAADISWFSQHKRAWIALTPGENENSESTLKEGRTNPQLEAQYGITASACSILAAKDERGSAFVEFLIALPFLLLLAFSLVDFGQALSRYKMLMDVAHEGVRIAGTTRELDSGVKQSGGGCGKDSEADLQHHESVHEKALARLTAFYNLDSSEICISSKRSALDDSVSIVLTLNFSGMTPFFKNGKIAAQARGPFMH